MMTITVTASNDPRQLAALKSGLRGIGLLNQRIATDALALTRSYVRGLPDHDTANRLGAKPTGHLAETATNIDAISDDKQATLLIPRASRLRAAFGSFTILPKKAGGFLTIPADAAAYGRRARSFPEGEVFPCVIGPKKTLVLARKRGIGGDRVPLEVLYILVKKANVKERRDLLPSDEDYQETTRDAVLDVLDEIQNNTSLT